MECEILLPWLGLQRPLKAHQVSLHSIRDFSGRFAKRNHTRVESTGQERRGILPVLSGLKPRFSS